MLRCAAGVRVSALHAAAVEGSARIGPALHIAAESFDVAVIGGGFAGTVVAVQLARRASGSLRIALFDRAGAFGRGAAYSPASDHCLLNVRAKAMGAFPDAEDDFLRWLRRTGYGSDDADLGERFLPRWLYGEYLCSLLERCAASGVVIERRALCVNELEPTDNGYVLGTACAGRTFAKAVVLAIGNLPPGGFGDAALSAAMRERARNPWELLAGDCVDRDADVLVVGTGLSALDVMLHLAAAEHRGRIVMLSRRGRFPLAHTPPLPSAVNALAPLDGKPRDVLRALRRLARDAVRNDGTWHEIVDGLRPQVNRIWQSWTPDDQRQFYRHVAPLWEVHRHRAPESTLAVRDALITAGQLRVLRGGLIAVSPAGEQLRVTYYDRERAVEADLQADVIVDCTGPRRDITNSGDPLIEAMFARRLAKPGPLGVGFAAAPDGSLTGGPRHPPLYALGTPLRGTLCESSAVREIRVQALTIAESIVAAVDSMSDRGALRPSEHDHPRRTFGGSARLAN